MLTVEFPEDARKHIIISKREQLDTGKFYNVISQEIDASPDKSTFVFVHGYNVSFDQAVLRTGQLAWDLRFRGPAITYSWPSEGRLLGYLSDIDMADWTAPHLEAFLADLRQRTGSRTIHLIAHSMGNRILTRALERLNHFQLATKPVVRFQELVLAAPDLNSAVLSEVASALKNSSDRVTIYSSARDKALRISAFLRNEVTRVGGNATALPSLPTFDIIDASKVKASLLSHSYFAENTEILNDLALLLKQRLGPEQRSVTLEQSGPIWIFRQ